MPIIFFSFVLRIVMGKIRIKDEEIGNVNKFKFLGSYITPEGDSETEINIRMGIARRATTDLAELWKSKDLSLKLKVNLAKALVWSIALYGCESWTLRKKEEQMIHVFELWLWRRVLRVSWREKKTNEWIRETIGVPEKEGLLDMIKKRKLSKYDYWKRRGDSLVLATIEGEVCAPGRRGRRRFEWIDNIKRWRNGMQNARIMAIKGNAYGSV